MTVLKARNLPVLAGLLCLLLMGFAGASYGAVRFDLVQSPTEVVNTGRSEGTGAVTLNVFGTGTTGTATGGNAQIGLLYTNPAMQIDNTTTSGIKIFFSSGFIAANPRILDVANRDVNGRCTGTLTIDLLPGAAVTGSNAFPGAPQDFIRIEGVRGRIDLSLAQTPGTDLFVDLQSANDPAASTFNPDRVRVAKSFDGMNVAITNDTLLLCFPTAGKATGTQALTIRITEGFARAFVDADAGNDGGGSINDRVDSGGLTSSTATPPAATFVAPAALGSPTNSTQFLIWLESIPSSVSGITWPASTPVAVGGSGAVLVLTTSTFDATSGTATATYSYEATNQTGLSDVIFETFSVVPAVVLKTNATTTGTIKAAVSLAPTTGTTSSCLAPSGTPSRPRFFLMYESNAIATDNPPDDPHANFASIIRCNCYLLFTYVTATSAFNTGIAIANTTGDTAVFTAANEAPDQLGKVTFYFYDRTAGFVGSTTTTADVTSGKSFVDLASAILPTGVTSFSGYVFSKAEFQFCHGFAFIADSSFASIAHGYLANLVPDPAIKGTAGIRTAADSGDHTNIAAGEGLNN
jgi:hypothetical protein